VHVVVDISAHGYGHLSLTAPVLQRLAQLRPGLRFTVRSALPGPVIAKRLQLPFAHESVALDFGLLMKSVLEVDTEASCNAYAAFHATWPGSVEAEMSMLAALEPDLLLSNIPYVSLAAATRLALPSVALCCLHWADMYAYYAEGRPECSRIHDEILGAYASAVVFLAPRPTMPMPGLQNVRSIGPIGVTGRNRRDELASMMHLRDGERLAFVSMGGMQNPLPLDSWRQQGNLRFIVPAVLKPQGPQFTILETLGMPVTDVIASVDTFITKPSYNGFVEAALAGTPVLYQRRRNWPEEPHILPWLQENNRCMETGEEALMSGDFGALLERLHAQPAPVRPVATGIEEAAQAIRALLA
jgi:hypothetical protein